ncbi:hypothetical protein [Streptomyces sp. SAS_272]|uniref:hypothetical protein n=1 Tax=Streptomyces sp. SAS_272 TaxID=3412747 RepID=UPI00403C5046
MKKITSSIATITAMTAALVAPGSAAQADTLPDYYTVEITFDEFRSIFDDCDFLENCNYAEVYGTLTAGSQAPGRMSVRSNHARNLAAWREEDQKCQDWISASWASNNLDMASCPREVTSGIDHKFSDTFLCESTTYTSCNSTHPYTKNNNKIRVVTFPGDQLKIDYKFVDKDRLSEDDVLCQHTLFIGNLNHSTLPDLSLSKSSSSGDSDSLCTVRYRVQTVSMGIDL